MMRDSEYILDKIILDIRDNLEVVENRLVKGQIGSMEDYKYNLGMRCVLATLQNTINEFIKKG